MPSVTTRIVLYVGLLVFLSLSVLPPAIMADTATKEDSPSESSKSETVPSDVHQEGISQKDVLLLAYGAFLGYVPLLTKGIIEFLRNRKQVSSILGDWHAYHFSRANHTPILRTDKWKIERRFWFFGIQISTYTEDVASLSYTGNVSFESSYVIFSMQGVRHSEQIHYRLTTPIPNQDIIMAGLSIGKDFDHEMYTSFKLLSQQPRKPEDVANILRGAVEYFPNEACLRLSRRPIAPPKPNT